MENILLDEWEKFRYRKQISGARLHGILLGTLGASFLWGFGLLLVLAWGTP